MLVGRRVDQLEAQVDLRLHAAARPVRRHPQDLELNMGRSAQFMRLAKPEVWFTGGGGASRKEACTKSHQNPNIFCATRGQPMETHLQLRVSDVEVEEGVQGAGRREVANRRPRRRLWMSIAKPQRIIALKTSLTKRTTDAWE
jgi:hypothetical protein